MSCHEYIESQVKGREIMEAYQAWFKEHSKHFRSGTLHFREGESKEEEELEEVIQYLWSCHEIDIDVAISDIELEEWLDD